MLLYVLILAWAVILSVCWLGWKLLRQNGRILLRLDELEKRLDEPEFGGTDEPQGLPVGTEAAVFELPHLAGPLQPFSHPMGESGPQLDEGDRASRFSNRSLARSRIKRDGLKAGTPAPDFRLPRLDGRGELALNELRGKRVLLVFSSPQCGPCNTLAPELEKVHHEHPALQLVMISKGEPKENRAKVKEHGLTFPVVLQQQWEISRRYAMFATPIAYLIDEVGVIVRDVAIGTDAILDLLFSATTSDVPIRVH